MTYTANGRQKRVLAWNAINANPPVQRRQAGRVHARLLGRLRQVPHRRTGRRSARRACRTTARRSRGRSPACKAPDGSYWALQAWQRKLPNYGVAASGRTGRVGAAPVALDRRACRCSRSRSTGSARSARPPLRRVHAERQGRLRLRRVDASGSPTRLVRAQRLRRHVQLGLRLRLEAREQLPDAFARRDVLLPRSHGTAAEGRRRQAVPRDRDRAGRDAGRDVDGRPPPARRARPSARRRSPRSTRCTTRAAGPSAGRARLRRAPRRRGTSTRATTTCLPAGARQA